jgi:hypothetical protein
MLHQLPSSPVAVKRMRTTVPFANVFTTSLSVDILEYTARESALTVPGLSCGEAGEGASKSRGMRAHHKVDDGVFTGTSFLDREFLQLYRS